MFSFVKSRHVYHFFYALFVLFILLLSAQKLHKMKKIILYILLNIFVITTLSAQNTKKDKLIAEGIELYDKREYKKAEAKYKEALKINPNSARAKYELALTYLELRKFDDANKLSTEVIKSNENELHVGAYALKSEALAEQKKIDEAIKVLHEGIEHKGNAYLLYFNLALNYYKKRDLDDALENITKAIGLDTHHSGAFLLNAYILNDKEMWVQSILSFQMFLLLEPDSPRSKNAFDELIQTMRIKPATEKPVQRSFVQLQLQRDKPVEPSKPTDVPPLGKQNGIDQGAVYKAITHAMDSLKQSGVKDDMFKSFMVVNKAIINTVHNESHVASQQGNQVWTLYVPLFSHIVESEHYETYMRYISASYFPESMNWWKEHPEESQNFIKWVEKGN